jgi:hypothetical protein
MNIKKLIMYNLLFGGLGLAGLQAQSSLNTTGYDASGDGGSVSYSIGQVAYQSHSGTSGSLAEGVQQAYEISVVTAIEETKGITLSVMAYPNPTADYLTLSIGASICFDNAQHKSLSNQSMSYQLYDMTGKLLHSEKITDNQTSIGMSNLAPANYFVKIIHENKEVKTFKIIKTL